MPLPRALRDRPRLSPQRAHILEAFYEVSAGRLVQEQAQPLQFSEILAYLDLMGVSCDLDRQGWMLLFKKLDAVYLTEMIKAAEK